ncbi:MAG: hypothetical protein RL508_349 [Actinomycetota bacterium]|jgi:NitT/TauT family transport system substrate-binding protein
MNIRKLSAGAGIAALIAAAFMAPSAASAASNGATATTIRIGYFANLTHAPALVAKQQKLFETNLPGVKIEYTVFSVGTAEIEALKGGALDAAYVGPGPALSGYVTTQGQLLNIVSGVTNGGAKFVVKPSLIATEGKPTKAEIAGLAGKNIADPGLGGTQDIALKTYLKKNALFVNGQSKANIIGLANADTLTEFQQGRVDGAWVPEPWATRLIQEGKAKVFVDEASLWPKGKFSTTVLAVSKTFSSKYPASVVGLLKANQSAINYLNNKANVADAQNQVQAELLAATGKKLSDSVIAEAWKSLNFDSNPLTLSVKQNFVNSAALGFLPTKSTSAFKGIVNLTWLNQAKSGK